MKFLRFGRVTILALFSLTCSMATSIAHPLPDSELTFSQSDKQLNLSIELPLEDLAFALPEVEPLNMFPAGQALSAETVGQVSTYFNNHLQLKTAETPLSLSVVDVTLQMAEHEDVGAYKVLSIKLTSLVPDSGQVFPLSITYDAVMHEVRNHRARVFWKQDAGSTVGLMEFGFKRIDGKTRPIFLERP